jgi:hypothetical protein
VIRNRALWMLMASIRADGERAAGAAVLAEMDPLVRSAVQSRVLHATALALRETTLERDTAHVQRLAFLAIAGHDAAHPDDVEAVRAAFEARARTLSRPLRYGATLGVLAAIVTTFLGTSAIGWYLTRPPAPLRAELDVTFDAWQRGGRPPPGDSATRALFEEQLPAYVVALDRWAIARGTEREAAAHAALSAEHARTAEHATRALGADTTSFLLAVLDQAEQVVAEPSFDPAADSHLRSVDALVSALAERGLGYYVDAEIITEVDDGRHHVYLSTFTVEAVRFYGTGSSRVRALRLSRLDRLSFARGVLGFTRESISDALVLLERIEAFLIDAVLPSLGPDAAMPLVDEGTRSTGQPWIAEIERAAAEDARTEARTLAGEATLELGALFGRRQALFRTWSERLASDGWTVRAPRTFDLDLARCAGLEGRVPRAEWRQMRDTQSELESEDVRVAYRALEEALVLSIERHEVQHRLDYGASRLTRMPPALERLTGPLEVAGRRNRRASRALAELSAYTSELARGQSLVRTNLALLCQHLFDVRGWGSAESNAALVIVEGLARHLGEPVPTLLVDRAIDRETLARLLLALRRHSADELSRAAAALWAELFGEPLPAIGAP